MQLENLKNIFNKNRAIGLIAASSIGTGIFTTTGFLIRDLQSPWAVLSIWFLGGIYSLLGVYSYSLLHKKFPGSGGEYHFLSRGIHFRAGILGGFVTILMGFTAPLAATCMAFSVYFNKAFNSQLDQNIISALALTFVFCVHWLSLNTGMKWHDKFIYTKLFLFILLVLTAYFFSNWRWPNEDYHYNIYTYANSFFWVAYAYSGWNSVYYIASEFSQDPGDINQSSFEGSLLIVFLYILLNIPLIFGTSSTDLSGVTDVVAVFFKVNTGLPAEKIISAIIALGLFSTISAFLIIAPRIYSRMAEDKIIPRFFYFPSGAHPKKVLLFQYTLTLLFILVFNFELILKTSGFILTSCSLLSVIGLYSYDSKNLKAQEWLGTLSYVLLTSILIYFGGPWYS